MLAAAGRYVPYVRNACRLGDKTITSSTTVPMMTSTSASSGRQIDTESCQAYLKANACRWAETTAPTKGIVERKSAKFYIPLQRITRVIASIWRLHTSRIRSRQKSFETHSLRQFHSFQKVFARLLQVVRILIDFGRVEHRLETFATQRPDDYSFHRDKHSYTIPACLGDVFQLPRPHHCP